MQASSLESIVLRIIAVLVLLLPVCGNAANLEAGRDAFIRGDYVAAYSGLMPLADNGDAAAQTLIGMMYARGLGVKQDFTEAFKWYSKAADQGDATAQVKLGWLYGTGEGIPKDYTEACKWFQKSADQGNAAGEGSLAACYYEGYGEPQNFGRAAQLYLKAAHQGNALSEYALAVLYGKGLGVPQDSKESVVWLQKSAAQGFKPALDLIAQSSEKNATVPRPTSDTTASDLPNHQAPEAPAGINTSNIPESVILEYTNIFRYAPGGGETMSATEAQSWYKNGFSPRQADGYWDQQRLTLDEAEAWRKAGVSGGAAYNYGVLDIAPIYFSGGEPIFNPAWSEAGKRLRFIKTILQLVQKACPKDHYTNVLLGKIIASSWNNKLAFSYEKPPGTWLIGKCSIVAVLFVAAGGNARGFAVTQDWNGISPVGTVLQFHPALAPISYSRVRFSVVKIKGFGHGALTLINRYGAHVKQAGSWIIVEPLVIWDKPK